MNKNIHHKRARPPKRIRLALLLSKKQSSCQLTVMEVAMQVALTGLGYIPFTPRTPFETWTGPMADGITVSWQRQ